MNYETPDEFRAEIGDFSNEFMDRYAERQSEVAPTAGEILQDNPEAFSPQYPDPTGQQGVSEDE